MISLGEAATHLPWLCPGADSLVALARPAAGVWPGVRVDPGAVLLLLRHTSNASLASHLPSRIFDPAVLDGALRLWTSAGETGTLQGFVNWQQPTAQPVYRSCLAYARLAEAVAKRSGRCDPDDAWAAGLLAPLGWLAWLAVDSVAVAKCLADPHFASAPHEVERSSFGLDCPAMARRLARRWRLPASFAACAGHLDLPAKTAEGFGADGNLFRIVQTAVGLGQRLGYRLGLLAPGMPSPAGELGLSAEAQQSLERDSPALLEQPSAGCSFTSPADLPLLKELVTVAADNLRLQGAPFLSELEGELDHLHHSLAEQRTTEGTRLLTQKLNAMAELAAGAGHEINNPLAVISGQAQYLLNHEPEPARQKSLHTIIGQTRRIHEILKEVMQYARPPKPRLQSLDVQEIVREVIASLGDMAAQRRVRLVTPERDEPIFLQGDPKQLRSALLSLVRNAIEAAPVDGWAAVRWKSPTPERVDLIVEDSGAGPAPSYREHLFDPFYSSRQAGRGRGLGLCTAWRLAREHGGDVYLDDVPGAPTRFVLTLPRSLPTNGTTVIDPRTNGRVGDHVEAA